MLKKTRVATGLACLGMVTASMVGPQVAGAQVGGGVDDVSVRSPRGFGGGTLPKSDGKSPRSGERSTHARPNGSLRNSGMARV